MPIAVRLLPFALAALAVAQVAPPSLGVVGRGGHGAVEIQGLPGSWIAAPALAEPAEAAASSPRQICWTSKGELHIRDRVSGVTTSWPVPEGDARFAFDAGGRLAAVWFAGTAELYTAATGWTAVYAIGDERSEVLDAVVSGRRSIQLLERRAGTLHAFTVDQVTGAASRDQPLEDRGGPALLDNRGQTVFAAAAGLPRTDAMQRLEHGWYLLSTAGRHWAWQPGMSPQAAPLAAAATSSLEVWAANTSTEVGDTITLPAIPAGSTTQVEFVLANTGTTDLDVTWLEALAPFHIRGINLPWGIPVGKLAGFLIEYAPTSPGPAPSTKLLVHYCAATDFNPSIFSCPDAATQVRSIALVATATTPPPGPALTYISPTSNQAGLGGQAAFTITVNGLNFVPASVVQWTAQSGVVTMLPTVYVSATRLTASVPASLAAIPGVATVAVSNPGSASTPPQLTAGVAFTLFADLPASIALTGATGTALDPAKLTSYLQPQVRISIASNAPSDLAGLLRLSFAPGDPGAALDSDIYLDDGSQQIVASAQQTAALQFTIKSGATTALFGTRNYAVLNTGTTPGTFNLSAALAGNSPELGPSTLSFTTLKAVPAIVSSTLASSASGIQLTLQGYDNTQSIAQLRFTFYKADGATVTPGEINADQAAKAAFTNPATGANPGYFPSHPELAGKFQLTATFPVTGDITQVKSLSIVLGNAAGTAAPVQIKLP